MKHLNCNMVRKSVPALAVALIALFGSLQAAHAQEVNCGVPYAHQDREDLRPYLVDSLRFMSVLSRLGTLAQLSISGNFSLPQRMALNSEYQALVANITTIGNWHVPTFRPRTNAWLHRIVDSTFLGLDGTDILTESSAVTAFWATETASRRFYLCY